MPRMGAYQPADRDTAAALWARVFPADPVPPERFDALPAAAGLEALTLGWEGAELAGFVLAQPGGTAGRGSCGRRTARPARRCTDRPGSPPTARSSCSPSTCAADPGPRLCGGSPGRGRV